jgi:hypothetical protein
MRGCSGPPSASERNPAVTTPVHLRRCLAAAALALLVAGCTAGGGGSGHDSSGQSQPDGVEADRSRFSVVATGDVLIHPPLIDQARRDGSARSPDFEPMLAAIKPVISAADLAICHIEAPFAPARGPFEGFPTFSMPPQVVSALAAIGYDECSTASNHSMDQGSRGLTRTLAALDADHIGHAGTAATPAAASRPQILDVHGIHVGHLSYTYGLNGGTPPPDGTWMVNVIDDLRAILSAAHELRRRGADVVILSLHWGVEYHHIPTSKQRAIANQLLASPDIDLIIGHHAHVVQPFERIRGKWVVYGLGNMIARHQRPRGVSEEGIIARFTFDKADGHWRVRAAEWVPTLVDLGPPIRLVELPQALQKQDLDPAKQARYQAAVARTRAIVESRGAASDGLSMGG